MSEDNLVMLRPVVVAMDVSVDIPSLFVIITLCFGTFSSAESASLWIDEVHRLYLESQREGKAEIEELSEEVGVPILPLIDLKIFKADILGARPDIQNSGTFIRVSTPEEDLRKMHLHALKEAQKIIERMIAIAEKMK